MRISAFAGHTKTEFESEQEGKYETDRNSFRCSTDPRYGRLLRQRQGQHQYAGLEQFFGQLVRLRQRFGVLIFVVPEQCQFLGRFPQRRKVRKILKNA